MTKGLRAGKGLRKGLTSYGDAAFLAVPAHLPSSRRWAIPTMRWSGRSSASPTLPATTIRATATWPTLIESRQARA